MNAILNKWEQNTRTFEALLHCDARSWGACPRWCYPLHPWWGMNSSRPRHRACCRLLAILEGLIVWLCLYDVYMVVWLLQLLDCVYMTLGDVAKLIHWLMCVYVLLCCLYVFLIFSLVVTLFYVCIICCYGCWLLHCFICFVFRLVVLHCLMWFF